MVQARLEGLAAPARRILRAASIFGQTCPRGGLAVLVRLADLDARLAELGREELLDARPSSRLPSEVELSFRHGVVREAAYAMLTDEDRALGHRLAGEWLETTGERDAVVLGEHYERGGDATRSARWYRRAAEQALEGGDLASAIARADRALACADKADVAPLRRLQAEAHRWRGSNADAERCALAALEGANESTRDYFGAVVELFMAAGRLGHVDSILGHAEALLVGADTGRDELAADRAIAQICAAATLLSAGRYELATRLLDALDDLPSELVDANHVLAGRLAQARALRARFDADLGAHLHYNLEAAAAYRRAGDLRNGCRQMIGVGYGNFQLGAFRAAESALREALAVGERLGLTLVVSGAQHNLGLALVELGEVGEARRLETAALVSFQAQGNRWLEGGCFLYLAEIELHAGELDAAEQAATRAVELLEASPPSHAYAQAVLAEVLLARAQNERALLVATEAQALLDKLANVDEGEAIIRLAYAEALDAAGEPERARAAFAVAAQRLLSRGERIESDELRQGFLEQVPVNRKTLARAAALGLG